MLPCAQAVHGICSSFAPWHKSPSVGSATLLDPSGAPLHADGSMAAVGPLAPMPHTLRTCPSVAALRRSLRIGFAPLLDSTGAPFKLLNGTIVPLALVPLRCTCASFTVSRKSPSVSFSPLLDLTTRRFEWLHGRRACHLAPTAHDHYIHPSQSRGTGRRTMAHAPHLASTMGECVPSRSCRTWIAYSRRGRQGTDRRALAARLARLQQRRQRGPLRARAARVRHMMPVS